MIILVSATVLLILAALLWLPLKISIRYNGALSFKIYVAGIEIPSDILRRKKQVNTKTADSAETEEAKFSKHTMKISEKVKSFADTFSGVTKLTRRFLTVDKFIVQITAGTGSAPSTAISTGMLWATVYNVIGILGNVVYIENPTVEITPDYGQPVFKSYAKCIISARIAYIILIGAVILLKKSSRKGKEE